MRTRRRRPRRRGGGKRGSYSAGLSYRQLHINNSLCPRCWKSDGAVCNAATVTSRPHWRRWATWQASGDGGAGRGAMPQTFSDAGLGAARHAFAWLPADPAPPPGGAPSLTSVKPKGSPTPFATTEKSTAGDHSQTDMKQCRLRGALHSGTTGRARALAADARKNAQSGADRMFPPARAVKFYW
jgi:hypothetical protein